MKKVKKESLIKYAVLGSFCILTLVLALLRAPFWDEANAWMISKSFNLFDLIFHIEKYDGHLFIWHGLIMPFAKFDFFYPYPMYILNWIFCVFALVVFWNKAPFSVLEKSLITFSYPFVWYFGIVARCYSIGILFLFLILSFWKERLKRPYLISLLIILLANTSAMALVGAFSLGLIFLFDLIKERDYKKIVYSILILGFGAISVIVQLWGARFYGKPIEADGFISKFADYFFLYDINYFNDLIYIYGKIFSLAVITVYLTAIFYFIKSKKTLFFFLTVNAGLIYIFLYKYTGHWWHYLFFFVYFISAIWFYRIEICHKTDKILNVIFIILLGLCVFETAFFKNKTHYIVYDSKSDKIARIIKKENLMENNDKIIALDELLQSAIETAPYFKNLKIYDLSGGERYTLQGYKNNMTVFNDDKNRIDSLCTTIEKNKINKGISKISTGVFIAEKSKNCTITYKPVYKDMENDFIIYRIIVKHD